MPGRVYAVSHKCQSSLPQVSLVQNNFRVLHMLKMNETSCQLTMEKKRIACDSDILHSVVRKGGKTEIFDLLLCQSPSLETTDDDGNTVLHSILANYKLSESEIFEFLEIFLDQGVDPNVKNDRQETALYFAVARRLRDVVDILIRHNAKINSSDGKGNFIAHFFIEDVYQKFRPILECKNDDQDSDEKEKASANFVEWLIIRGFDFDAKENWGRSALQLAIVYNLLHIVCVLLKRTNDTRYLSGDYKNTFPPFMTKKRTPKSYYKRYVFRIMKILLDRGLHVLIERDEDAKIIEPLIDQNECAASLFHAVIRSCGWWSELTTEYNLEMLRDLMARGVDVNTPNYRGLRPAFLSVEGRSIRALKFLEENGADFQVKNMTGQNLLGSLVVDRGFGRDNLQEVFDFLISKGCDVNDKDSHGTCLLHLAAELNAGSKNKITVDWDTLIAHYQLSKGNLGGQRDPMIANARTTVVRGTNINQMLGLLLKQGGYVNVRDADGKTPLYRAMMKLRTANIEELLEWGANVNDDCITSMRPQCDVAILFRYLLVQHWIKLKAADLPCSLEYEVHADDEDSRLFRQCCLKEVPKLKTTFINSRTSLHRLLRLDSSSRCVYVNNDKFRALVDSPTLEREFPLYAVVILASYREAVARKSLLLPVKEAWLRVTEIYLPDVCLNCIFACLDNVDLVNIIEEDKIDVDNTIPRRKIRRMALDRQ